MSANERLGIEYLSVFGLPPVAFVELAAELGCHYISTGLQPFPYNPHGYAPWSLLDAAQRRETVSALRTNGIRVAIGEGLLIWPGRDIREREAELDALCELGAQRISTLSIDADHARNFDQFAALAEMAAARGLPTALEFGPCLGVPDLPTALAAVRHVGRADFGLVLDAMHVFRSGATLEDVRALDPQQIGHVQLCDAPRVSNFAQYSDEARFERLAPGAGELPLQGFIDALPRERVVGLEIPQRTLAEAGLGPRERLAPCVTAARALLAAAG